MNNLFDPKNLTSESLVALTLGLCGAGLFMAPLIARAFAAIEADPQNALRRAQLASASTQLLLLPWLLVPTMFLKLGLDLSNQFAWQKFELPDGVFGAFIFAGACMLRVAYKLLHPDVTLSKLSKTIAAIWDQFWDRFYELLKSQKDSDNDSET